MSPAPIDIQLIVEPAHLAAKQLSMLMVRCSVINNGVHPIDSGIRQSQLLVNGEPSLAWSLAIGNGTGDEHEHSLPSGERVDFSRQMGRSLLRGPGSYTLVLRVLGVDSAPVTVQVSNE